MKIVFYITCRSTNVYEPKKRIVSKSQNFVISVEDDEYKYIQGNIRDGNFYTFINV